MTNEKLLKKLGEDVFGWEFLETTGSLPKPSDDLYQALDGKRRPVFWLCDNPNVTFQFFVAEPGTEPTSWNPLENRSNASTFSRRWSPSEEGCLSTRPGLRLRGSMAIPLSALVAVLQNTSAKQH
jgi:hypothetical protein